MSSKHKGSPKLYKGMKSLNPNGRPKGSMNKFTALSRELMSIKGPEIVQKVVEFRASDDRGNVIINVGGLEAKKVEIEEKDKKELTYEDGVIIDESQIDETIVSIANG